jgi:ribosomal protein S18 acetylase RimI-like enzyme
VNGGVLVELCGVEAAGEIHRLTQRAFAPYGVLDPPSGAVAETEADVAAELATGGGALARSRSDPAAVVGCLRWRVADDATFHVRRLAVEPACQRRGVGLALMAWADDEARARGCPGVTVGVRVALPGNREFFRGLGFAVVGENSHAGYTRVTWLTLRKDL